MLDGYFTNKLTITGSTYFEGITRNFPNKVKKVTDIHVEALLNSVTSNKALGKVTVKQGKDIQVSFPVFDGRQNPGGSKKRRKDLWFPVKFNPCEPIEITYENYLIVNHEVLITFKTRYEQ